jgi:hypothetical protein
VERPLLVQVQLQDGWQPAAAAAAEVVVVEAVAERPRLVQVQLQAPAQPVDGWQPTEEAEAVAVAVETVQSSKPLSKPTRNSRTTGSSSGAASVSGSQEASTAEATVAAAPPTAAAPHLPADAVDGGPRENVGAAAVRLAASSSSARFFASACRSLHVILPLEPQAGRGVGSDCVASEA